MKCRLKLKEITGKHGRRIFDLEILDETDKKLNFEQAIGRKLSNSTKSN